ncbi:MAG: ribonuclease P protein component [Magnetococcales bacterium]|nr:ribonuclease P protein component [Magnetococcales bacterium]
MIQAAPEDFRFPKSARLLTSREFQRVSSQGRRTTSRLFILLTRDGQSEPTRIGITVSRKVGNAVHRSRVKRIIRETFRLQRPKLKPGLECVIIAKPLAGQTVNAELSLNLRELLARHEIREPN